LKPEDQDHILLGDDQLRKPSHSITPNQPVFSQPSSVKRFQRWLGRLPVALHDLRHSESASFAGFAAWRFFARMSTVFISVSITA